MRNVWVWAAALGVSAALHVAFLGGGAKILAWTRAAAADEDETLAQLDLTSVDLSFSEEERESAPVQTAPPSRAADTPPPPPPPPPADFSPADLTDDTHQDVSLPPPSPPVPPEDNPRNLRDLREIYPPPVEIPPADSADSADRAEPRAEPSPSPAAPAPQQARLDAKPAPTKTIRPVYPQRARERGEEGIVTLEAEISPNGRATAVRVVSAPPYPDLRAAAVKAVRAARFTPGLSRGRPVQSTVRLSLQFRLNND